jgi:hypothetical protein
MWFANTVTATAGRRPQGQPANPEAWTCANAARTGDVQGNQRSRSSLRKAREAAAKRRGCRRKTPQQSLHVAKPDALSMNSDANAVAAGKVEGGGLQHTQTVVGLISDSASRVFELLWGCSGRKGEHG